MTTSEIEVNASTKHLTLNPVTKEWEMLTTREWKLLKLGFKKDDKVDDWTLAIIAGPEHAVGYGFKVYEHVHPGGNRWLVKLYKEWFKRTPNTSVFVSWCYFISDHYNIPYMIKFMDDAHKLKIELLKNSIDAMKLTKKIQVKQDSYYSRNFKKSKK